MMEINDTQAETMEDQIEALWDDIDLDVTEDKEFVFKLNSGRIIRTNATQTPHGTTQAACDCGDAAPCAHAAFAHDYLYRARFGVGFELRAD